MWLRIGLNSFVFASILFFPWWMTVGAVLVLLFSVEAVEVLLWGLFIDVLYSAPLPLFFNITLVYTALFTALFFLVVLVKKQLIFYDVHR